MKELTPAEAERIAATRREVHSIFPEVIGMIGALHQAGLIDGWRSIRVGRATDDRGYAGPLYTGRELCLTRKST